MLEAAIRHTRIVVSHYGGPAELRPIEEECPEPAPGEVRVRVLAAGVSLPMAFCSIPPCVIDCLSSGFGLSTPVPEVEASTLPCGLTWRVPLALSVVPSGPMIRNLAVCIEVPLSVL